VATTIGPRVATDPAELRNGGFVDADLQRAAAGILNRHPCVGLVLGVIRDGDTALMQVDGFADLASRRPVTPDTVFRIGSITKTFTAMAVMQLWERGLVDIDAPASAYLRSFRLVADGFAQPTVRHLLTHTAGIPDVRHLADLLDIGAGPWDSRPPLASVPRGQALPALADYYASGLDVVVQPGTAFAYSNHGFAALGQVVEDVSGLRLDRYLREHVFGPAGMTSTGLVRSAPIAERLATGYAFRSSGPRPVPDRDWIGAGAGGAYSSLRDLVRYVLVLLGGAQAEHGPILRGSTLAAMLQRQHQTDSRLPAMGLGFFLRDVGPHAVVGHDGILPGFNSHLSLVPDAGLGLIALTNGSHGAMRWLPGEMDGLMRQLLDAAPEGLRRDIPHRPAVWDEVIGRYVLPPRIADLRGRLLLGDGLEIFVSGGRPMLRVRMPFPSVWRGAELHPDDPNDPLVFRVDLSAFGIGLVRLCFRRERDTGRMLLHTDLGGRRISFERVDGFRAGRLVATLATAALIGGAVAARRGRHPRVRG
jgi:CubicO group peptidase (beta-lactamase class C family)